MRDHHFIETFCNPSHLLQKRLTAWRLRPTSALEIYATSDFGNEPALCSAVSGAHAV